MATAIADVERFEAMVAGLETRLAEGLPAYMIPNVFIPLSTELALTSSGKLDRKRGRKFPLALQPII